jgi:hypothetical protein
MSEDAKKARTARKAAVTKAINSVKRYVAEEEKGLVKTNLETLVGKFKDFEISHEAYHELLKSDDEIEASDTYLYAVQDEYVSALNFGKQWLHSQNPSSVKDTSNVKPVADDLTHSDVINLINLPKVELETFDGDPAKYHSFITVFDEVVDQATKDDRVKLTRLMQYTSGRAKEAIRFCTLVEHGKGYSQARDILHRRFGNDHLVATRLIQTLKQGRAVKSPEDLLQLADDLSSCYFTLLQTGNLQEVQSQSFIIDIASRLQTYLQIKWKKRALDIKNDTMQYPSFKVFVEFVRKEADDANDPVYGKMGHKPKQSSQTSDVKSKGGQSVLKSSTAFSSSVSQSNVQWKRPPCVLCKNDHKLLYCSEFKAMKPVDRLQLVKKHALCENCLLDNHVTESCKRPNGCGIAGCNQKHTRFIHIDKIVDNANCNVADVANNESMNSDVACNQPVNASVATNQVNVANSDVMNDVTTDKCGVLMPIVGVKVNDHYDTCALLDNASSSSFCTQDLVNNLKIQGCSTKYVLNTLGNSGERNSKIVSIRVSSPDGKESLYLPHVYVVEKIPVTTSNFDVNLYPHLQDLSLVGMNRPVQILLGQDNSEALVPLEVKRGKVGDPFAVRTLFGWSLNGPAKHAIPPKHNVVSHFICASTCSLEDKVQSLWDIENEGLTGDKLSFSQDETKVIKLWDSQCRKVDGHYELPIPWKPNVQLANNLVMAMSRLKSLRGSLNKRGLTTAYDQEIKKLLAQGYAEPVSLSDVHEPSTSNVWYLPHHAVVTEKKPGKTRVVFDCAFKFQGESLNSNCYKGPDFNNKLLEVLLRFRQHSFAVTSDIEAMYNQVYVPEKDRDYLRFLWFDDQDRIIHYRMTRHLFGGVWCSSAASYALRHTVLDNVKLDPLIADTVMNAFYVDDCLKSVSTRNEALMVIHGTKALLSEAGFNLTKFVSNDAQILQHIPENDRAKEFKQLCPDSKSTALGLKWDVANDAFYFDVLNSLSDFGLSRRKMLSTLASVFDPLGLISPIVITGKLLFQESTRLKLPWDMPLPPDLQMKWKEWLSNLKNLSNVYVPRCVKPTKFDNAVLELHHFSDASQNAYGCCTYLRCLAENGDVHVSLLMSKSKVAPLKQTTIPRLELQAAVLAAKVDHMLKQQLELDLSPSQFWTDSEIVLKYISNETRKFHVFVGNRISIIRELTQPSQWHYVAGIDNPADVLSRGQSPKSWNVQKWIHGPKFLWQDESLWSIPDVCNTLSDNDPEIKLDSKVKNCNRVSLMTEVDEDILFALFKRFSSWYHLKRAVSWLLRFKFMLQNGKTAVPKGPLTVDEIQEAECAILKCAQSQSFAKEIKNLLKGKSVGRSSALYSFDPFLDNNGLLKVGGRIKHAKF